MEAEMREQPDVLARGAAHYLPKLREALADQSFDMVAIAARGSSDNAALYARYLIEVHVGIPVCLIAPSVITRYRASVRYPRCLGVGISQSGAAPDVSEVLAYLRDHGHATLAITNTPGSRLATEAGATLLLEAGEESSVAATKTYTASLVAVHELARALGGDLPAPPVPTEAWLDRCRIAAEEASGPLLRSSILFSLGRGYDFCSAHEAALKLMECALLPCKAYSTADFEHGPKALAGHSSAAVVFGEPPSLLEEQGCLIVRAPAGAPGAGSPIWNIFFGQWLALHAARARGLDPDAPRHIAKITRTL